MCVIVRRVGPAGLSASTRLSARGRGRGSGEPTSALNGARLSGLSLSPPGPIAGSRPRRAAAMPLAMCAPALEPRWRRGGARTARAGPPLAGPRFKKKKGGGVHCAFFRVACSPPEKKKKKKKRQPTRSRGALPGAAAPAHPTKKWDRSQGLPFRGGRRPGRGGRQAARRAYPARNSTRSSAHARAPSPLGRPSRRAPRSARPAPPAAPRPHQS